MDIKNKLIQLACSVVPKAIKRRIITDSKENSIEIFSQEGEDKLLERFVGEKKFGIYVDIGAHHPTFLNNTFFFYKKGWRGINIDATPGSMKPFEKLRPYDINIEQPIANQTSELEFHIFSTPELNTFDKTNVAKFLNYPYVNLEKKIKLTTVKLENLLERNLPRLGNPQIDFFTIDVEGMDLDVLKSNNWNKFRPNYVLVEDLSVDIFNLENNEIVNFMTSVGYTITAKTVNTLFFKKNA
ncbi:MAG: FkbM family methyltransferase [Flavobacterium sp.]|nr:MAG: FkbM family methyltransferase [Flavobacterium sp.]